MKRRRERGRRAESTAPSSCEEREEDLWGEVRVGRF